MFLVKRQNDTRNRMGMFAEPMDTLLGRFFGDWPAGDERLEMSAPAIDLTESEDVFAVVAELPGMSEADIDLSVMDDVLTISGEKTIEEHPDDKRHHTERRSGKFSRQVRFSTPSMRNK